MLGAKKIMTDHLGIVHIEDMAGFAAMREKLYGEYGLGKIFGKSESESKSERVEKDFPEPLQLQSFENEPEPDRHGKHLMYHLLHESARQMMHFVHDALGAVYQNNPIFSGMIDRESLAQIVDRAMRLSAAAGVDICGADLAAYERRQCDQLVRALVNVLTLTELLVASNLAFELT